MTSERERVVGELLRGPEPIPDYLVEDVGRFFRILFILLILFGVGLGLVISYVIGSRFAANDPRFAT